MRHYFQVEALGIHWIFSPYYAFQGDTDGNNPAAGEIFGRDGTLYGTESSVRRGEEALATIYCTRVRHSFCQPKAASVSLQSARAPGRKPRFIASWKR